MIKNNKIKRQIMKYIDLSHKMTDKMNVYPGDHEFELKEISTSNDSYSLSKISGGLHTGTHIDAPYHYIPNGKKVSDLEINSLIGKASILKTRNKSNKNNQNKNNKINDNNIASKCIKIKDLNLKNSLEKIIILNTGYYKQWGKDSYFHEYPYISKELAKLLIENEISGIAIDTPSVDRTNHDDIHKIFLKNNVWIVENLTNMDKLKKDIYYSYFIPMNIKAEASYVRAFVENMI